ncbi:MAG: phosphotransferase, partial [Chloroflexota bacterium]|nr:phosphotransferase [Chloroflexota bacterium]
MMISHLDPQAILQALGVTDATAITPVHGGSDTAVWRIEWGGESFALRVFREGEHDDCEREKQVMQAALDAGLPVPQVHREGC